MDIWETKPLEKHEANEEIQNNSSSCLLIITLRTLKQESIQWCVRRKK